MSKARESRRGSETKGAASAAIVFVILVAVVAVVAGAALLLGSAPTERAEPAPSPAARPSSPDMRLTDEEAIERFMELDDLRIRAYEGNDVHALRQTFLSDGPAFPVALAEIRRLKQDGVTSATRFENLRLDVVHNTDRLIELRQVRVIRPRFLTEAGENITFGGSPERQVVRWVLRPAEGEWLIYDSVVTETRKL